MEGMKEKEREKLDEVERSWMKLSEVG